jgi:hypothetical protein
VCFDRFDVLILKLNFKNKKYYFNAFRTKNTLKNNHCYTTKYYINQMLHVKFTWIIRKSQLEFWRPKQMARSKSLKITFQII